MKQLATKDKLECARNTAEAMKHRFERDQFSLQESLQGERDKQKMKIFRNATARTLSLASPGIGGIGGVGGQEQKQEIDRVDANCSIQETFTLSHANESVLLALAAIKIDERLLQKAKEEDDAMGSSVNDDDSKDEDEDDDYFDEEDEKELSTSRAADWYVYASSIHPLYTPIHPISPIHSYTPLYPLYPLYTP